MLNLAVGNIMTLLLKYEYEKVATIFLKSYRIVDTTHPGYYYLGESLLAVENSKKLPMHMKSVQIALYELCKIAPYFHL